MSCVGTLLGVGCVRGERRRATVSDNVKDGTQWESVIAESYTGQRSGLLRLTYPGFLRSPPDRQIRNLADHCLRPWAVRIPAALLESHIERRKQPMWAVGPVGYQPAGHGEAVERCAGRRTVGRRCCTTPLPLWSEMTDDGSRVYFPICLFTRCCLWGRCCHSTTFAFERDPRDQDEAEPCSQCPVSLVLVPNSPTPTQSVQSITCCPASLPVRLLRWLTPLCAYQPACRVQAQTPLGRRLPFRSQLTDRVCASCRLGCLNLSPRSRSILLWLWLGTEEDSLCPLSHRKPTPSCPQTTSI